MSKNERLHKKPMSKFPTLKKSDLQCLCTLVTFQIRIPFCKFVSEFANAKKKLHHIMIGNFRGYAEERHPPPSQFFVFMGQLKLHVMTHGPSLKVGNCLNPLISLATSFKPFLTNLEPKTPESIREKRPNLFFRRGSMKEFCI